ncbi:hypothetical protein HDU86_001503 [Geranomyces michiganensis]|nr:hypothetical protein HDU86_001503 [Geranomyces michiganensis]
MGGRYPRNRLHRLEQGTQLDRYLAYARHHHRLGYHSTTVVVINSSSSASVAQPAKPTKTAATVSVGTPGPNGEFRRRSLPPSHHHHLDPVGSRPRDGGIAKIIENCVVKGDAALTFDNDRGQGRRRSHF